MVINVDFCVIHYWSRCCGLYNYLYKPLSLSCDCDSDRRDTSPQVICQWADVSVLRFLEQIGIVSDRQTTFIARYLPSIQTRSDASLFWLLQQAELSATDTPRLLHVTCRVWSLIASISPIGRNYQRQIEHVFYTLRITYANI